MRISFIVTTYNIEKYIRQCLNSVAVVARDCDEIIIVDDGSEDATVDIVRDFCFGESRLKNVTLKPIFLGQNTIGGVGIAGNIGLAHATNEAVFFVDGDDWLNPDGFREARDVFEAGENDVLIVNYEEFDEVNARYKAPADEWRWSSLTHRQDVETLQNQALEMIAVPWRKFYRRAFLELNNLRFPEGDFFFEDNPFHWAVCLKTERISFLDVTLCYHRINRPGQTMASTGRELIAFFDHYETICEYLGPDSARSHKLQALQWLLGNMSWHLGRLQPEAAPDYFRRAEQSISKNDQVDFDDPSLEMFMNTKVNLYVSLLRARGWAAALDYFLSQHSFKLIKAVQKKMDDTHKEVMTTKGQIDDMRKEIMANVKVTKDRVTSLHHAAFYEVLYDTYFGKEE